MPWHGIRDAPAALYIPKTVVTGVHCTNTRTCRVQGYAKEAGSDDWGASKRALLAFARSDNLLPAIRFDSIKALVATDIQYMDRKVSSIGPSYRAARCLSCSSLQMSVQLNPDAGIGAERSPTAQPAGW